MSIYTDKLKDGMRRVTHLTHDYEVYLKTKQNGMAAVTRGELMAARAYLQGLTDAGEVLFDIDSDIHYTEEESQ